MFDGILGRGPVASLVADDAWLAACLDVEAALARVEARAGLIQAGDARRIEEACRPELFDATELGAAAARSGNPIVPLVAALRARVSAGAADDNDARRAAAAVHLGATSQDILDTAAMLVAARAIDALLVDLDAAADAAAALTDAHRDTIMVGRTLLQHALPTTFGAEAASWLAGLDAAARALRDVRRQRLAVQFGGAVGSLASLGEGHGMAASRASSVAAPGSGDAPAAPIEAIVRDFAAELGLAEPVAPWHAERTRISELAGVLGETAAAIAKPALDLVLLAQGDVREIADDDPDRGTSSTLPQKRNPVAAVSARACAAQAPGLAATLFAVAGSGEHERGAGSWQAEWRPLTELLRSVGSAAAWLRDALEHVRVDAARMRENVEATGGTLLAERVVGILAPRVGHEAATEAVRRAAIESARAKVPFSDVLGRDALVATHLDATALRDLLDPATYLGSTGLFIDRTLSAHRARSADGTPSVHGTPERAGPAEPSSTRPVRLHAVTDGPPEAPVLVLLHSLGTNLEIWQPQVERLRTRFRIVRVDLRGHGRSPVLSASCSIEELARDVLLLLDELGIPRAHVCGLSIGGMVAMWLAANAPTRVDRVVLCATSARLGPAGRWAERARRVERDGMTAIVDGVVEHWLTPAYASEHPELATQLRAMLAATDATGYVACCRAIETMDLLPDLARIAGPTLVVSGADDAAVPAHHGATIAAAIAGARHEVVADAAHQLNVEQADAVSALISEHLSVRAPAAQSAAREASAAATATAPGGVT